MSMQDMAILHGGGGGNGGGNGGGMGGMGVGEQNFN